MQWWTLELAAIDRMPFATHLAGSRTAGRSPNEESASWWVRKVVVVDMVEEEVVVQG